MNDLTLYESGGGGDAILLKNDLDTTESIFNMVYLAWFGGNVKSSTIGNEIDSEFRFDWWGNNLLFQNEPEIQFNSSLERILNTTSLDSEGRVVIEEAAKDDIQFLNVLSDIEVNVSILSDNKVEIFCKLTEPDNIRVKEYQFIWDATKNEVIVEQFI